MSDNKIKINIMDVNETSQDNKKVKIDIEDSKKEEENFSSDNSENSQEIKYNSRRRPVRTTVNKIFDLLEENKNDIKDDLNEIKSRTRDKKDSLNKFHNRNFERIENFSELPKNIIDEFFLSTDNFYNRIKYEKNKNVGREIKVDKKE